MITIITPLHTFKYLENTLTNFYRQEYNKKELLIICNGELFNNYKSPNKHIHTVHINSSNIAQIRNAGLNWMQENNRQIFSFFDSDDYYSAGYLSEAYNKLISDNYDIVGKLNYKFKYDNDIYEVKNLEFDGYVHGPTITGYLSELRFDEQYHSMAEDIDFVGRHKRVTITSSNNWIYTVRNDSIQRRSFTSFIETIKFVNCTRNKRNVVVLKNNELYWNYDMGFDIKLLFK